MNTYKYQCELSANGQMYTSTYTVEGKTEDEAWEKGEERLWDEWESIDITPIRTTIELLDE